MSSQKKLFGAFSIIIAILLLIFISQYNKFKSITTHPSDQPLLSANSMDIPIDASDPVLGNPGAPITIVEFSSLDCKPCRETHLKISDFVEKNSSKVRLYWKDTTLPKYIFQMSKIASAAVYCSSLKNPSLQFKFIDSAIRNKINFNEAGISKASEEAGLNGSVLWECANSADAQAKSDTSMLTAQSLGIKTLPTIFVNNKKINLDEGADLSKLLESVVK